MRCFSGLILVLFFLSDAMAYDLGTRSNQEKSNTHLGQNPGTPDGRQGGEDMASALVIGTLPFSDTGNTSDNIDDYDAVCPYTGSPSADVVYSFTPAFDVQLTVDLCGSGYDTKTYIMDGAMNVIACNDDFYNDETCGVYVSMIEIAELAAGTEYFIVIDGYGGDAGDYILELREYELPPCTLTCNGWHEDEPELMDGYEDAFNGGCNSPEFNNPILQLIDIADYNGDLEVCGKSGWYNFDGHPMRDTDWMYIMCGDVGWVGWTLDSEYPVYGFLLGGDCANGITVDEEITAGPCSPATMTIQCDPGDGIFIWVGPTEFSPPFGFEGYEFNYVANFTGIEIPHVATENISFDAIKSLYR